MPTYDYKCPQCSQIVEIQHSIREDPVFMCKNCNIVLERLIGCGQIIVKNISIKEMVHGEKMEKGKEKAEKKKKMMGKKENPWWRSGKNNTINKDILKNPEKYIMTGDI